MQQQNWRILATDCTQAFANAKPLDVHYVRLPKGFPDRPYNGALAALWGCLEAAAPVK